MKKKNIVFIAKSLDGFVAGKNGELDWLESIPNPENNDMGYVSLMQEIDAIVIGKTTFEVVCGFGGEWPYVKHVFVLSNSLKVIPEKLNKKVTLIKGSPQEILGIIHKKGYSKLYIDGGRTVQNFLKEDLIDELRITTITILLGGGFSLFGDLSKPLKFEHLKSEVFLGQMVQDHYKRKSG
jgi:dihydrofolate reductase